MYLLKIYQNNILLKQFINLNSNLDKLVHRFIDKIDFATICYIKKILIMSSTFIPILLAWY